MERNVMRNKTVFKYRENHKGNIRYNYKIWNVVFIWRRVKMREVYYAMLVEFPGLPKAAKVEV